MLQFSKPILLTAMWILLTLCGGCSSPVSSEHPTPRSTIATAAAPKPTPVAKQYSRPAQDLSSFDPRNEAVKMGIQLYPGATLYSSPYTLRRGNYYVQHVFFTTVDSPQQVAEFYESIYGANEFSRNVKGNLSASISPFSSSSNDMYQFELLQAPNGNTNIDVQRIHSCENMYPKPCDSNGDAASTGH